MENYYLEVLRKYTEIEDIQWWQVQASPNARLIIDIVQNLMILEDELADCARELYRLSRQIRPRIIARGSREVKEDISSSRVTCNVQKILAKRTLLIDTLCLAVDPIVRPGAE